MLLTSQIARWQPSEPNIALMHNRFGMTKVVSWTTLLDADSIALGGSSAVKQSRKRRAEVSVPQ